MKRTITTTTSLAIALAAVTLLRAQQPLTPVIQKVNEKVVKIYGAGGFKGLPSYGSGVVVSPKGHILTINNHIVSTQDIYVELYDGRKYRAKLISREPELDVAMLQIEAEESALPHFDFSA